MNEWTFECWIECWMNVCKPENSSYETRNFSSNIWVNMQKICRMKCWTGLLRPFLIGLLEHVYMRSEVNSNRFKISLRFIASSFETFTWIRGKWISLRFLNFSSYILRACEWLLLYSIIIHIVTIEVVARRCSIKKIFLKILHNSQENTCILKKRLQHRIFSAQKWWFLCCSLWMQQTYGPHNLQWCTNENAF